MSQEEKADALVIQANKKTYCMVDDSLKI